METAESYRRLGELQLKLGIDTRAETTIREAIRRYEDLLRQSPNDSDLQYGLAKALQDLGHLLSERPGVALPIFKRVAELAERLVKEQLGVVKYQELTIRALSDVGRSLSFNGAYAEGRRVMSRPLDRSNRAQQRFPEEWHLTYLCARVCEAYAEILWDVEDSPAQAAPYAREAIDLCHHVLKTNPRFTPARELIARSNVRLASALPPKEAIRLLSDAIANYSTLASEYPDVVEYRRSLYLPYAQRSHSHLYLGDVEAARDDMEQAVRCLTETLAASPNDIYCGIFAGERLGELARLYEMLGQHEEAREARARLERLIPQVIDAQPSPRRRC